MNLTWTIPEAPKRDLLVRFGRRWVLVADGNEVHTRKKYSRYWSESRAQDEAASLNRAREHFGQEPNWSVIDLNQEATA